MLELARPSDDQRDCNVITSYHHSSEKKKLTETVISNLIDVMYEFCSEEYGHGIEIASFDDFCHQYWERKQRQLENCPVFSIHYFDFEKGEWKCWNVEKFKNTIYIAYVHKYGSG